MEKSSTNGSFSMAVLNNQRVTMKKLGCHGCDGFEKNNGIGLREKYFHRKLHIFLKMVKTVLSASDFPTNRFDGIKTGPSLLLKTTIHYHKQ